ncbi:hypothetical protein J437_LFUL009757 [Ladona fulva]|uniref:Large ribosomal subunit protein bL17m n=1 Tax=Ladona fulva TaxID=123851 RepID=A0A8K0P2B6_LADFU|nr:hypothetical protein J437_LFUL009757 [Ladona fulva]
MIDLFDKAERETKLKKNYFGVALNSGSCYIRANTDMFAVPNMLGFMHTTHFLLKIIYPNTSEFRDCWPVFEKSQERDFRNKATKMLRLICTDFPNFQFPEIIPSKFMSPGGFWFITIMWNLTVLAMQVQGKRDLGCSLLYKPSGKLKEINKPSAMKLLSLITRENHEKVEKVISSMELFRKGFNETKQYILDKKLKYKLSLSQLMSSLDENELWNSLDGNLKNEIIISTTEDYWSGIREKLADASSKVTKCCNRINVDVLKNQAEIIDEVRHREELGHNYVINDKNLVDEDCNEIFPSKHLRDIDDPEDGKVIRLLDYFSKPLEELNSMKLDKKKEDVPFQIKDWERVHKEWEENKNEMTRLELLLNSKLADINAKYNQERDLPVSKLRYPLNRARRLKNPEGPEGRLNKLRKTVTGLFKYERIELNYNRADEARGYAERLISDAVRHGDNHAETMQMANYWLLEKQLVHKLFKVFVPRYQNSTQSYTRMINAPRPFPGDTYKRAVLELKGNPFPSLTPDQSHNRNLIHNVLLEEARKEYLASKFPVNPEKSSNEERKEVESVKE